MSGISMASDPEQLQVVNPYDLSRIGPVVAVSAFRVRTH